jgi:serine phosphatase RsbU (regulator of sigma subunit)
MSSDQVHREQVGFAQPAQKRGKKKTVNGIIFRFLSVLVLALACRVAAQGDGNYFLSADSLQARQRIWLDTKWKYHPGDPAGAAWARPDFDDGSWELAGTGLEKDCLPASGWPGIGWFRIPLAVDSSLWRKPLIMTINQAGASQVYLNGELIYDFGEPGLSRQRGKSAGYLDFANFSVEGKARHVFAVRYANYSAENFHSAGFPAGFYFLISHADVAIERGIKEEKTNTYLQMFFSTLALAFGILHLVLFMFSPQLRSHLYFSIFAFLYAGNIFFDYQAFLAIHIRDELFFLRLHRAFMPSGPVFILLFIYSLFPVKIPKQFWLIALGLIVTGFFAVLRPIANFNYIFIFAAAVVFETIRVMRQAIRDKKDGAWIITAGFMILAFFSAYDALLDLNLMQPIHGIRNGYPFGFLGLIICMSIYLSRDFARTNEKMLSQERRVKEQELQQRLLEADNARKTKELEDARALQLSMLPRAVPDHPHIDIGVFMGTATEVGGDYYDFHHAEDGTLTAVIGDATGHGTKAGIMVAILKSLFSGMSAEVDILRFFDQCTSILKKMNLGNLYMALSCVRIKAQKMRVASAGMPPILIYHGATKTVEEIIMKTMPLGAHAGFPYQQKEINLATGDTILLMTDGFAELFNDKEEILDYPAVVALFKEAAGKSPAEIIGHLYIHGEKWRNGQAQRDDITFVVMKVMQ